METIIRESIKSSILVHERLFDIAGDIKKASELMVKCIISGNKVIFAGNGGSAADSQHLAAELVNRFRMERKPMAGLALTTDTSVITSIGNDYSFDDIFTKQLKALGQKGDVFLAISTSGNSRNILNALRVARDMEIGSIGLTGKGGGSMKDLVDVLIDVPSTDTARIQEAHILIGHILCEIVEREMVNADMV